MHYKEIAAKLLTLPDDERATLAARYVKAFSTRDNALIEIENLNVELLKASSDL